MDLLSKVQKVTQRAEVGLDLSVYKPGTLEEVLGRLEGYLTQSKRAARRSWWPWGRKKEPTRVSPLLLSGPVGTGKTTLMMLLDLALPQATCGPLFEQEILGHVSTAQSGGGPVKIQICPLTLMGYRKNIPTGVIRLRELQTFYRLYTYDRGTMREDEAAAKRFAELFRQHIVFIDEFVPDVVTSFPMKVINRLADHGVLVVLSSNRRETPYVEGVQVVPVEGDDMRTGDLSRVCLPAKPDPLFDQFSTIESTGFDHVARGLRAKVRKVKGKMWMYLNFDDFANVPADWLAFQHLLQYTDVVLIDQMPLFDPQRGGGADSPRRFTFLIDAIYDERRPVRIRLTNTQPLPKRFEAEMLRELYLPELLIDLERSISRLRQLSSLKI
ncbi:MAG: hypothetical protein ACPGWR_06565 [Ardenticatenaceae bacterium]